MTFKQGWMLVVIPLALAAVGWPQADRQAAPRVVAAPAVAASARADSVRGMDELSAQLAQLNESHTRAMDSSLKMSAIYASLHRDVEALCQQAGASRVSPPEVAGALGALCKSDMSYNLQYLQLQTAMQNENRQFTMVSNIMKTKHDTVKNSISNIR
ncbi:MAG TPA: hypothetical protein VIC04_05745 [Terriglobia bacterium]|jgi:hypothetical protein